MPKTPKTSASRPRGPGSPAAARFAPGAAEAVRREIAECGGNEVFFLARLGGDGLVAEAEALARGGEDEVPAPGLRPSRGEVVVHNHPGGILVPSGADLEVASRLGAEGVGFFIVDNRVSRVYAVVEPAAPEPPPPPLDREGIAAFFAAGGPLSLVHPRFEPRPAQARMAAEVARVLEEGAVGVYEAGTGTGKSLSYLLPAALWALAGRRRVAVATRTITLQEQQLRQDLPLLARALGRPVRAAVVKGRGNYLCLRKRDNLGGDGGDALLDLPDLREIRDLLAWSESTADGSLSDLSAVPRDALWDLLRSESDSCLRARCPCFSSCFFYRARREAAGAQLLLANHHVLFADLALRAEGEEGACIMPRYDAVVMDEAHDVEETALSFFDSHFSRWAAFSLLGRLVARRRADKGLAPFLVKRLSTVKGVPDRERVALMELAWETANRTVENRGTVEELFARMGEALGSWLGGDGRFRIHAGRREEPGWEGVSAAVEELSASLGGVLSPLRRLTRRLRVQVDEGAAELAGPLGDLAGVALRLEGAVRLLSRMREGGEDGEVFWTDVRRGGARPAVALHLTPLDAAGTLRHVLFDRQMPVVFTSATLTVGGSFDFLRERLGLDALDRGLVREKVFPTPFDLSSQMTLSVAGDLAEPEGNAASHGLAQAVGALVEAAGGGALALFTSYRALDAVFEELSPLLARLGVPALRQGEAPRTALLDRFRREVDSVLFATDSFWEGIDVMGESLRLVVITRLPFDVPTDPVMEARRESLLREGRDPFMEDAVPRAVIRFRQGVGRLIRHRDDRGCVVVCDRRLLSRGYGRVFLASLPEVAPRTGSVQEIAQHVKAFLRRD
jgi:ATP-dependent DNA helicase DinG